MEANTQLVHRGNLETVVADLLSREQKIVAELTTVLEYITEPEIRKPLANRLTQSQEHIKALEGGYIPVDGGFFQKVDRKSSWLPREMIEAVNSMPEDARQAWERAQELGIFKSYGISGRGGDPMLVGVAGKKNFLIAAWTNFEGGFSAGFRVMGRK